LSAIVFFAMQVSHGKDDASDDDDDDVDGGL
jgi:hypothetical protein